MKRALIVIAAFLALALLLTVVGALLPTRHTAAVRITLAQPPEAIYQAVTDVARATEWRTGLDSLRVVSPAPLRWRESTKWGTLEFLQVDAIAPRMVRAEIQGAREQGFGGTWTWDIVPRPEGGTVVTITENGEVYNPIFRLLSRYIFGHYSSLEQYARDLGRRFGETVTPERVGP